MTTQNRFAGSSTRSRHLFNWVTEMAWFTKADRVVWCDGSELERQRLTELAVAARALIRTQPKQTAWLLSTSFEPQRCGARRRSHLHLHAQQRRGGTDKQLDGT